jgi:hypothetical protein
MMSGVRAWWLFLPWLCLTLLRDGAMRPSSGDVRSSEGGASAYPLMYAVRLSSAAAWRLHVCVENVATTRDCLRSVYYCAWMIFLLPSHSPL